MAFPFERWCHAEYSVTLGGAFQISPRRALPYLFVVLIALNWGMDPAPPCAGFCGLAFGGIGDHAFLAVGYFYFFVSLYLICVVKFDGITSTI